jgi:flap endonuclease-1
MHFVRNVAVLNGVGVDIISGVGVDINCACACFAGEKGFNEDRVRNQVKKINAAKGKASQGRLESFFGPVTVKPNEKKAAKEAAAKAAKGKAAKGGSKGGLAAKGGVKKAPIAAGKKK